MTLYSGCGRFASSDGRMTALSHCLPAPVMLDAI